MRGIMECEDEIVECTVGDLWRAILMAHMVDGEADLYSDSGPLWYDDFDEK